MGLRANSTPIPFHPFDNRKERNRPLDRLRAQDLVYAPDGRVWRILTYHAAFVTAKKRREASLSLCPVEGGQGFTYPISDLIEAGWQPITVNNEAAK